MATAVETYHDLYIERSMSSKIKAQNLIRLVQQADQTEMTCIEELVRQFLLKDSIDTDLIKNLMEIFTTKHPDGTCQNRAAIQIVRMVSQFKPQCLLKFKETMTISSIK